VKKKQARSCIEKIQSHALDLGKPAYRAEYLSNIKKLEDDSLEFMQQHYGKS